MTEDKMLTTKEAADILGVSEDTMNSWRYRNRGPRYYHFERSVRYKLSDLKDYMERARQQTNSRVYHFSD